MSVGKDLVAAAATPRVLGILAVGESYGSAILKRVGELSGGQLAWTEGMLYPLLHRLERLGYVDAAWRTSSEGRRRKHYCLTPAGRAAFVDHGEQWRVVSDALRQVWTAAAALPRPPATGGAWA